MNLFNITSFVWIILLFLTILHKRRIGETIGFAMFFEIIISSMIVSFGTITIGVRVLYQVYFGNLPEEFRLPSLLGALTIIAFTSYSFYRRYYS